MSPHARGGMALYGDITRAEFFPAVRTALAAVGGTYTPRPEYWRMPTMQTGPFVEALLAALNTTAGSTSGDCTWFITQALGRNDNTGAAVRPGMSHPIIFEFIASGFMETGLTIDRHSP